MRAPSDPVARLAKLEAARAEVGPDETFKAEDMARVAGMTWRNMREIVAADPDFPIVSRGGPGLPYVFNGVAVLEYMIAGARAVQAKRAATEDRATFLAGIVSSPSDESPSGASRSGGPGVAAREMLEHVRTWDKIIDVRAKLRAEMVAAGDLVRRKDVDDFLWRWLSGLQSSVLAIEQRIDKANLLEPAVRRAVKDELNATLVTMRADLEKEIAAWNARRAA